MSGLIAEIANLKEQINTLNQSLTETKQSLTEIKQSLTETRFAELAGNSRVNGKDDAEYVNLTRVTSSRKNFFTIEQKNTMKFSKAGTYLITYWGEPQNASQYSITPSLLVRRPDLLTNRSDSVRQHNNLAMVLKVEEGDKLQLRFRCYGIVNASATTSIGLKIWVARLGN